MYNFLLNIKPNFSFCIILLFFIFPNSAFAQLGFCSGDKGDAIFEETFGTGTVNGPPLAADVTTYTYVSAAPEDGFYTISNELGQLGTWHNTGDHTEGDVDGKALIVNASFTPDEFFSRRITGLCENTSYEFSSWIINLYDPSFAVCSGTGIPVNVRFEIWNAADTMMIASGSTGNIDGTTFVNWQQYALVFETGIGETEIILKMRNNGVGGCGNDLAIDDIVFRACGDNISISSDISGTDAYTICDYEGPVSTTLTATPEIGTTSFAYQWETSTDGIAWAPVTGAMSATYTTPLLNVTTYYRVNYAVDPINLGSPFCSFISDIFEIEVIPAPAPPISDGNITICDDETIPALSVTVAAGEKVSWYDAATGGTLLLMDSTTYTPTVAGTYYAEAYLEASGCVSSRTAIDLIIVAIPDVPISNGDETICEGETIPTLSVTVTGAEKVSWYDAATGGTLLLMDSETYTPTDAGIYYAEAYIEGTDCVSARTAVALTIIATPNAPISDGDITICEGETIPPLSVTVAAGEKVSWYDAATGGTLLLMDSETYTPTVAGIYYAEAYIEGTDCVSARTAVTLTIAPNPNIPISNGDETICEGETIPTLSVTVTGTEKVSWYDAATGGTLLLMDSETYTPTVAGIYYAEAYIEGTDCVSARTAVALTIIANPDAPTSDGDQIICVGDTIPNLSVTVAAGEKVSWYDAATGGTLLLMDSETYTPTVAGIYYAEAYIEGVGCISSRTAVELIIADTPMPPISGGDITICDTEEIPELSVVASGIEKVAWYTAAVGGDLLVEDSETYTPAEAGTYYAEAYIEGADCVSARTAITLTILVSPDVDTSTVEITICEDFEAQTLDAGAAGFIYNWNTGETTQTIEITSAGTYTVDIENSSGCSVERTFIVTNIETPIFTETTFSEGDDIVLETVNTGNFEFSLDGINYQESGVFANVEGGPYTAYVRNVDGCDVVTKNIVHLRIPKYFSPNEDLYNDLFEIKGLSFFRDSEVLIFNRYGKLLTASSGADFSWDGTLFGRQLPSDDYWYRITVQNNIYTGHFTLKR